MAISFGASAIVFDQKGRVLVEKRDDLRIWVFPGGHMEKGEFPEMVAVRETEEETGIKIKISKLVAVSVVDSWLLKSINFVYLARKSGGKLKAEPGETVEVKFVAKKDLPKFLSVRHFRRFRQATSQQPGIKIVLDKKAGISLRQMPAFIWRRWLKKLLLKIT